MAVTRELRSRIVIVGVRQWAEHGAAGFSVARIARELGVSTASPYRHFADRDVLLVAVIAHAADQLTLALTEAADSARPEPVDRLRAAAAVWVGRTRASRIGLAEFTRREVEVADPAVRAACRRPVEFVTGLVGAATDTDVDRPASDVLVLLHGYATAPAGALPTPDDADLAKAAAAAVIRLLPSPRRARRDGPDPSSAVHDDQVALF